MRETWVPSLGWEDLLEKEIAAHSSILAWKIPWTEKPGRLQAMGSQRVGHDWATSLSLSGLPTWYVPVALLLSLDSQKRLQTLPNTANVLLQTKLPRLRTTVLTKLSNTWTSIKQRMFIMALFIKAKHWKLFMKVRNRLRIETLNLKKIKEDHQNETVYFPVLLLKA